MPQSEAGSHVRALCDILDLLEHEKLSAADLRAACDDEGLQVRGEADSDEMTQLLRAHIHAELRRAVGGRRCDVGALHDYLDLLETEKLSEADLRAACDDEGLQVQGGASDDEMIQLLRDHIHVQLDRMGQDDRPADREHDVETMQECLEMLEDCSDILTGDLQAACTDEGLEFSAATSRDQLVAALRDHLAAEIAKYAEASSVTSASATKEATLQRAEAVLALSPVSREEYRQFIPALTGDEVLEACIEEGVPVPPGSTEEAARQLLWSHFSGSPMSAVPSLTSAQTMIASSTHNSHAVEREQRPPTQLCELLGPPVTTRGQSSAGPELTLTATDPTPEPESESESEPEPHLFLSML